MLEPTTSIPGDAEISERSRTVVIPPLSRYARGPETASRSAAVDAETEPAGAGASPHPADAARVVGPEPGRTTPSHAPGPTPIHTPIHTPLPRTDGLEDGAARRAAESRRQVEAQRSPASLPVPAMPPPHEEAHERVPFWKRIAMYRPAGPASAPAPEALESLCTRIAALERQLTTHEEKLGRRLDAFEENITRLWEIEEQMSLNELRDKLAFLQANQEEMADSLHALGRNAGILTGVLVVIAAGVAFALARLL